MEWTALRPMLMSEVKAPFSGPEWLFEIKYDGYRLLADIDGGDVNAVGGTENAKQMMRANQVDRSRLG
jgi:hypothetical protein